MVRKILNVGVIGTGEWTQKMYLPLLKRCKLARVVAICGHDPKRNRSIAHSFRILDTYTNHHALLERDDIDFVVVSTSTSRHFEPALDAVKAGMAVLCEKPLTPDYLKARKLSEEAKARGVKTKVAFIFRYSPVFIQMKELIMNGFIGQPFHFNGIIQNSRYSDPKIPFPLTPTSKSLLPGSLQEYSPHLIDLALWLNGNLKSVSGLMKNFIPRRLIRDYGETVSVNFEDGCVWLGEFTNGAEGSFQSSFVTFGPNPGLEIRIFGSNGALIAQTATNIAEPRIGGTLFSAMRGSSRFLRIKIPSRLTFSQKSGHVTEFGLILLRRLLESFVNEIVNDHEPEDNFQAGADAQEVASAVYLSHLEKRWVTLPLP